MDNADRPAGSQVDIALAKLAFELVEHFENRNSHGLTRPGRDTRVVAFVGAGASRSAGLPLGQPLKEKLFLGLTSGPRPLLTPSGAREECRRFWSRRIRVAEPIAPDLITDPRFSLLQFCQALSAYGGVREELRDLIGNILRVPQNCHLLAYELLGHLINHRFVDHVISLNFDQLLDKSLQDELGSNGIDFVISERDIPESVWDATEDKPIYVKPHGSIDVRDSMRFTLADTFGLSGTMEALIARLVFGAGGPNFHNIQNESELTGESKKQRVILLFIGWACAERELQRLLGSRPSQIDQIYWFYPSSDNSMPDRVNEVRTVLAKTEGNLGSGKAAEVYPVPFETSLDSVFLDLLRAVHAQAYTMQIRVPPIARHLLYCYCFSPTNWPGGAAPIPHGRSLTDIDILKETLNAAWDRLKFEVYYFSLKTKGTFSSHNMSQVSRIQESFTRFRQVESRWNQVAAQDVPDEMKWTDDCDLVQRCFSSCIIKESPENYTFQTRKSPRIGASLDQLLRYFFDKQARHGDLFSEVLSFEEESSRHCVVPGSCEQAMLKHLIKLFPTNPRDEQMGWAANLARHLESVRGITETEIAKRAATRHFWFFKEADRITSIGALNRATVEIIENERWTKLEVIAETGEWLLEPRIKKAISDRLASGPPISIHLFVRDEPVPLALEADHKALVRKELLKLRDGQRSALSVKVESMPWWKHNRHLTLLSMDNEPVAGIYFRRRLKTPLIYPVRLKSPHDLRVLQDIVKRYKTKARDFRRRQNFRRYTSTTQ